MSQEPLTSSPRSRVDPDAAALRRASRSVGLQIAVGSTLLVLVVIAGTFSFVFAHLNPDRVFDSGRHESTIDVGGLDILVAATAIGFAAIGFAALLSWFATRRAVRPLGEALRLQRTFVANASHELRTPLAVLDARLQYLQRGLALKDPAVSTVAELRRDTSTLVQIVNDLLVTAEEGDAPLAPSGPVDVVPIIEVAVESMSLLAAERDLTIELTASESVTVLAPAVSIHRCLVALLDNAQRYAPAGSTVTVALTAERNWAEIRVTDRGPGITGLNPTRVFERFARGERGDGSEGGSGIGLALVRDTVTRWGGSASVENTGPSGTTMLLRVPRARRR